MQELAHVDATAAEVRAYVEGLLTAPLFVGAPRRARLIRYLVERTLAGEGDQVNEYSIGVDVFGKPPLIRSAHPLFGPDGDHATSPETSSVLRTGRPYRSDPDRNSPAGLSRNH